MKYFKTFLIMLAPIFISIRRRPIFLCICFFLYYNVYSQRNPIWAIPVAANHVQNFYQVDTGIYRCSQPDKQAFMELSQIGISTVVNLRYIETDKQKAKATDLQLYHVKMRASKCKEEEIVAVLHLIKNRQGSIVIHCKHGADRTGLIMALYRIVFQGWDKESAIAELQQGDYHFHPIFSNIIQYIRILDVDKLKEKLK